MHEFRLADALRYSLPGAVLLLATGGVYPEVRRAVGAGGLLEATVLAGAALVLGSLIQTVHRALLYPLIYRGLVVWYVEERRPGFRDLYSSYTPSETEMVITERRWRFAAQHPEVAGRLGDWRAQTHFLYASSVGLLGGALVPCLFGFAWDPRAFWSVVGASAVVAAGAFVHDRRLMLVDQRFTKGAGQSGSGG